LRTAPRVESVVFGADGVLGALRPSAIHISMSTISVALADRLTEEHQAKNQGFVSAPVFGRPEAAAAAVAAGAPNAVERCLPLFQVLGQRSFIVGQEPAKANLVKLSAAISSSPRLSRRSANRSRWSARPASTARNSSMW
jgi:3-hydroxyisobutyrate dehydrogenase-like beta-hydroxyacid dehydrogenase